ncbi:MAG TPA: alpha/beta fold hydrolase [Bacteroidetes bacterium]|nr:alpha/beta fold hydrolase [Bacteroidota bacterium]HIL56494.1 alpha/beta fold hydrolase [Rhodothermales bacterium]
MPVLTVLALHGFMGRSADWDAVAADLGSAARVLAPDLAGHGEARDLPADFDAEADRLAGRIGEPVVVAGYSMGGRLAQHLAVRHPEIVRGLVLVSTSPGLRTEAERAARRAVDAERARAIAEDFPAFLERWYRLPLWGGLAESLRQRLVADRLAHNDPAALGRSLAGMGTGAMAPLWSDLSRIRVPAAAVAGLRDPKYVALADEMARAGPLRVTLVPEAGHALLSEAPHAVADAIRTVLFP